MRAGSSIQLQVKIKNNMSVTYTVSINKNAMPWGGWVQIDNNSQTLAPNLTVTFLLTITVPVGTEDGNNYYFPLYFNAYDSYNINNPYTGQTLHAIVDNSPPTTPQVSVSSKTSTSISITFSSYDARSSEYTDANTSSGIQGIKSYTLVIKDSNNNVKESKSVNATDIGSSYTFGTLASNTEYTTTVSATDLATNTSTSPALPAKTPPAAPVNFTSSASYCSTTLAWAASPGATSYNVYNSTATPSVKIATTTAASYTVTGLSAGTAYKFYVTAESSAGTSNNSSTISTSTLTVPTPTISSPPIVCTSGTFSVTNLPSACSVSWYSGTYLSLSSASGSTATFTSSGNGSGWVMATFNSGCGSKSNYGYAIVGSPKPGAITIDFDAPPQRFTASIAGVTSATTYRWYLDGVLKYNTPETSVIFLRQLDNCDHVYYVDVTEENQCGISAISHAEVSEDPCYYVFTISPNPASENITLVIETAENTASAPSTSTTDASKPAAKLILTSSYTIRILDGYGALKATLKGSGETVTIPVSNFSNGIYIVEVNDGKKAYRQQLLVRH